MRRLLPEFETWIGVQWACFCNWLLSVQNRTDTALCQLCCLAQCALVIVRERRKIAKVAHDVSAGHKVSVQLSGVWPHLISWHFQRSTAIVLTEKCWGLWCSHLRIRVAHQTCDFYFEGWTALQNRVLQIVWIYKCSFGLHIDPIPLPKSKMTKCDQLMWTVLHWDTIVFVAHPKGGRTWRGLRGSIQMSLETCWSVCDGDCGLPLWDWCQEVKSSCKPCHTGQHDSRDIWIDPRTGDSIKTTRSQQHLLQIFRTRKCQSAWRIRSQPWPL